MPKTVETGQLALIPPDVAAGTVAVDAALTETADTVSRHPGAVEYWAGDFSDPVAFDARVDHLVETMPTDYDTARKIAAAAMGEPRPDWMPQEPPRSAAETRAMLANMGIAPTKGRHRPHETMTRRRRLFR